MLTRGTTVTESDADLMTPLWTDKSLKAVTKLTQGNDMDPGLFWHTVVIRCRDNRAIIGPTEVPFYSINSCSSQTVENYYVWFLQGMALKRKKLHIQIT